MSYYMVFLVCCFHFDGQVGSSVEMELVLRDGACYQHPVSFNRYLTLK
jgi:hypothetical protein